MKLPQVQYFNISERKVLLRLVDLLAVLGGLQLLSTFHQSPYFNVEQSSISWYICLSVYITFFATIFELYDLRKAESKFTTFKNLTLSLLLTVLFFLLTPIYTPSLPENRIEIVFFFGTLITSVYTWRIVYIYVISSPRFNMKTIVVGDDYNVAEVKAELEKNDPNFFVKGYLHPDPSQDERPGADCFDLSYNTLEFFVVSNNISEIIVINSLRGVDNKLAQALIPLLKRGFSIRSYTQVYEDLAKKVPIKQINNDFYCHFPFSKSHYNKLYQAFHKLTDLVAGTIGLLFLLAILPFVLIINSFFNKGPVFYKQARVGKHDRRIMIYKLRTMLKNSQGDKAKWAVKNDKRVTKFGKILRRTRLDELPQLINVLKGDMSFIGPRPEQPEFVEDLKEQIPFYEMRHVIKPGITGWAQVNARYAASAEDSLEKLQYDLYYIKKRNLFLDLRIVLKTFSTVIFFRGQ